MDNQRITLLQELSQTISDYYIDGNRQITTSHIDRWLNQFHKEDQPIILYEMNFIMRQFYFSRLHTKNCLRSFISKIIDSDKPKICLSHMKFLYTRQSGNSQPVMLNLVDEILQEDYGLSITQAGTKDTQNHIYIDDAIYTGNKMRHDHILQEAHSSLSSSSALTIYVIAAHKAGARYALNYIRSSYNKFSVKLFRSLNIEDERSSHSNIEIIWPGHSADDSLVNSYVANLCTSHGRKLAKTEIFRSAEGSFQEKLFSSSQARKIVEKAFLVKGIELIQRNQSPAPSVRPLGFMKLASLGFGTFFVTYRNIANNCPLVLWYSGGEILAIQLTTHWVNGTLFSLEKRTTMVYYK